MATSSITKDFVVKDVNQYRKLIEKIENNSTDAEDEPKISASLELERGKRLLIQQLFR